MDSDRMESDRMSNSANPESDRMDSARKESDIMDYDRKESDRRSKSANPESDRIESGRNQLKKKSGGRHHVRPFFTTTVFFSYSIFPSYCYLYSLSLSFTDYK
jgi:hypothetical protein